MVPRRADRVVGPYRMHGKKRAYGGTSYSASMASGIARCAPLSASRYFTAAEAEFWAQIVALVLDGYRIQ